MADERKIVIELKNIEGDSPAEKTLNNSEANQNLELTNTLRSLMHPIKTLEQNTVGKNVIVNQAYQYAKQAIKSVGEYHIWKYFTLNENYLAETDYQNIMTGINKITSFGSSIATGAIIGSKLGPVGAIAGVAISSIGWGVNEAININKTLEQEKIQMNERNYQSSFQQTRLGLVNGRGVTNQ